MAPTHAELLQRNKTYATDHQPLPTLAEIREARGDVALETCIVSCADPRVIPEDLFGLQKGEAIVFRTIAGHPQPVIEDILALDRVFGGYNNLLFVHHTDCGATHFKDSWVQSELAKSFPTEEHAVEKMHFGSFSTSIEDNVREDLKWFKQHPLVGEGLKQAVKGYVYDIKTGKVTEVE